MAITTDQHTETSGDFDPRGSRVTAGRRRRVRRVIALGLLVGGVCLIGYVAWQYFGTNWITSRAQSRLRTEVAQKGFVDYPTSNGPLPAGSTAPLRPVPKDALGYIRIPRIGLDMIFIEGTDPGTLKLGPGHYPGTPLPGQGGNVGIAGHRTTYLHPFWALNELKRGDQIILQTRKGMFVYKVEWLRVINPNDIWVVAPTKIPSLTLTTCNPRFSAAQRLVVRAVLVSGNGGQTLTSPSPSLSRLPGE
jgi:sortase A